MINSLKRIFYFITSPTFLLWVLIVVVVVAIVTIACSWSLTIDQILSISIAALAFPLAFLTQQAILREDKRQKLRLEAYEKLQIATRSLSGSLTTLAVSSLDEWNKVLERQVAILQATAGFTNLYHSYEMVFKPLENEFRYIHFLSQKLTNLLSTISVKIDQQKMTVRGYTGDDADDLLQYQKCKEFADDILSYLYDLEKDCMKELHFDSLFSVVIEDRRPNDKKYKILKQLATDKAVKKLEKQVLSGGKK